MKKLFNFIFNVITALFTFFYLSIICGLAFLPIILCIIGVPILVLITLPFSLYFNKILVEKTIKEGKTPC